MTHQHIYEGTPQELVPYLAQRQKGRFRLIELEEDEGPAQEQPNPVLDDKAKAPLALLASWIAEGKAADEKTRLEADREVEEFKRNMNANRAATGESPVYP